MDTGILEKIGFTKGEIKVYLSLIELGNTTSGPIILKSGAARSKVYEILEKLKKKGLVTESIQKDTKYFQAASPKRILDYIQSKENELKKDKNNFIKLLPKLVLKQKHTGTTQEVKIYDGFEGIKSLHDEIVNQLAKKDEYLAMTFSDAALNNNSIILMFKKFHQKRAKTGAKAKIICNSKDKLAISKMNYSETKFYEFRTTKQILPTGISIAKDMVITINWGKTPKAFVIICKENAEQYRKFFYAIWKDAKKLK
ncbi:MAG: hypothetical protein NUV57_05915 [archaeon]|nr:hypothetical protein [archaeon]